MKIEELREKLEYYFENDENLGIVIYALFKDDEEYKPKKLDIEAESLSELKNIFLQSIKENIFDQGDLSILNLSSSDERLNAIYLYDIEIPDELSAMETVITSDSLTLFNLTVDDISNVKAFLIEIGDNEHQVVLYKTLAPVNIFGRTSFFLKKSDERFVKIKDEFLRISSGFQLMKLDEDLIVIDLKTIEKFFGFHEIIKREALAGLDAIDELDILENPETLRELVEDVKYARRYTKVAKMSPVIKAGIDNKKIIQFCKIHPALINRIKFNNNNDKLLLDTIVSKNLFIKLLMDDFLTSELTEFHYTSEAKDSADEIEN